jgi:hypothetical protein
MDTRPIIIATICMFMLNNSVYCWMQNRPTPSIEKVKVKPEDLDGTFLENYKPYLSLPTSEIPIPEWKGSINGPHDQETALKTLDCALLGVVWALCKSYEKYHALEKELLRLKSEDSATRKATINLEKTPTEYKDAHILPISQEDLKKARIMETAYEVIATTIITLQLQVLAGLVKVEEQTQIIKTELAEYERRSHPEELKT